MAQIDRVTQQNAALVEEAAAAAESLQEQATQLVTAVVAFKLEEGQVRNSEAVPVAAITAKKAQVAAPAAPKLARRATDRAAPTQRKDQPALPHDAATRAKPRRRAATGGDGDWKEF
jgi:methyl-accepting chemotaxis protein